MNLGQLSHTSVSCHREDWVTECELLSMSNPNSWVSNPWHQAIGVSSFYNKTGHQARNCDWPTYDEIESSTMLHDATSVYQ